MVRAPVRPSTPRTTLPTKLWTRPRLELPALFSAALRAINVAIRELVLQQSAPCAEFEHLFSYMGKPCCDYVFR